MGPFDYLKQHEDESIEQLKDFLRIPSISALSDHKDDVRRAGKWVTEFLNKIGLETELCETGGHPCVVAEYKKSGSLPTVLIYGHYDVQPVDPLDLWKSSPFDPIIEGDHLIARGVADDKGQVFAHIKGVEAYLKTIGSLPLSVKFLIEGEEESGAVENLNNLIKKNKDRLAADIVIVSDTSQYGPEMPAITFGLRGIAAVDVKITGPSKDLHSGSFGGSVANPINVLSKMIAKLHDENGRITIPGFYDKTYTATKWERDQFSKLPFNKDKYLSSTGASKLWGEKGYSPLEQNWIRPTLDCNGITGGYQGEGGKTIIPSWASTKITMRLVPDMNPDDISDKFEAYLKKICPDTVKLEVIKHGGANPVQVPTEGPWLSAAARAIKTGFGREPYFTKEGGSIPVVETFKLVLGADTLLIGFGQHTDNIHSPNEHISIKDFHRGCQTSAALLDELSKIKA